MNEASREIKFASIKILVTFSGGDNMQDTWISFVTDIGFPVAVTFYLMHRIESKLDTLNESIVRLPEKMNQI